MSDGFYKANWPKDSLYIDCFVHEVVNFRYHWHPDEFEINILLQGQQYFCRGKDNHLLKAGDVVVVSPNVGHASYGQDKNTVSLVIHFSSSALKQIVPKGASLSFDACCSDQDKKNDTRYKRLKDACARLILTISESKEYSSYISKAYSEMIISILCECFSPSITYDALEIDEDTQKAMRVIMAYIEENFREKISLDDIASITQYNRTYISTLFHKAVGITFYEYLMRVRLQNAIKDVCTTDEKLTDIALSNGFSDLKSFNKRFKEMLSCLPSEYKHKLMDDDSSIVATGRRYLPCNDPSIIALLKNCFIQ